MRWYADASREVNAIPRAVWDALTAEQQAIMRFPVASAQGSVHWSRKVP